MREQIDKFKDFLLKESKIIPNINNSSGINIRWIDEKKKKKEVGFFDLIIKNGDAVIVGYRKDDKTINGYDFIKKSIDYLLGLGYSVVSRGNRSDSAIKVWDKLEKEYVVEKDGDDKKNSIKKIISKK
jgi:hypothetical protein